MAQSTFLSQLGQIGSVSRTLEVTSCIDRVGFHHRFILGDGPCANWDWIVSTHTFSVVKSTAVRGDIHWAGYVNRQDFLTLTDSVGSWNIAFLWMQIQSPGVDFDIRSWAFKSFSSLSQWHEDVKQVLFILLCVPLCVLSLWADWMCLNVCVHAFSPHPATSAYCVNTGMTHWDREREREPCSLDRSAGLWAISARSRSDKLQTEGGEKAAAAAGGDLWHSHCTVKCSLHGHGGSDRGIKLWIYSCLPAGQRDGTVRTGAGVNGGCVCALTVCLCTVFESYKAIQSTVLQSLGGHLHLVLTP